MLGGMRRLLLIALVLLAVDAAPAAAFGPAPIPLPDGAQVADVPLGGLYRSDARAELERRLSARFERPVVVRVRGRGVRVPTKRLGQTVRYGLMLDQAFDRARLDKPVSVPMQRTI